MRLKFNKYRQYKIFACLNQRVHVENCFFLGRWTSFSKPLCTIARQKLQFYILFWVRRCFVFRSCLKRPGRVDFRTGCNIIEPCGYYPEKHFSQHVKTMGLTQFMCFICEYAWCQMTLHLKWRGNMTRNGGLSWDPFWDVALWFDPPALLAQFLYVRHNSAWCHTLLFILTSLNLYFWT